VKALHYPSFESFDYQIILRWRWLVLFAGVAVTVLTELVEGHSLTDPLFWVDVFLFGLLTPSITWLLLTLLAHNLTQRRKTEARLIRYRQFTQQLSQHREWDELVRFVTEFAGALLPVDHTALFTYDHRNARLEYAASWHNNAEGSVLPINAGLAYDRCQACLLSNAPSLRSTAACNFKLEQVDDRHGDEFCLPFSYNHMLVGLLRLKLQPGEALAPDQIEFLNGVAPEIALALALAISFPRQMAQVRNEAQMDERQYIAYVLHNSLAQQIGYLHLSLDRLAGDSRLEVKHPVRDELEQLRVVAGDAYERIRNTLALLRAQEQSDLTHALTEHVRVVSSMAQLAFEFTTQGEPRPLLPDTCQRVVALVQEGLNNVIKHAHARRVHITLNWAADGLSVNLADDGIGFDPSAPPPVGHYGLAMMDEGAKALGGALTVLSAPGRGTELLFRLPLSRHEGGLREAAPFANLQAST
jgi:signal transduction histidine kinase